MAHSSRNNRARNLFLLDQNTKALFSKRYLKSLNNHVVQLGTKGFDGFIIASRMHAIRKKDDLQFPNGITPNRRAGKS